MRLLIKTIILASVLFSNQAIAQPVIGNNMPDTGFATQMYLGTNISSAGTGGANVSWDFSWQSSFNFIGDLEYMTIDGTEFEVDFPTCNLVARKRIGGDTTYNYYTNLGNEVIINGENMGAVVFGKYITDKKQLFLFPMNYGDSLVDTWQSTMAQGKVRRYYDGWGTLQTYFYTFHNVARIKTVDSFLSGANWVVNTSYTWYTTDKLLPVAHYDANQQMTILKMFPVSVSNTEAKQNKVSIAPNPVREQTSLYVEQVVPGMELVVTNAVGQVVKQQSVINTTTIITRDNLSSGIYFYRVQSKEGIAAKGKLVIE